MQSSIRSAVREIQGTPGVQEGKNDHQNKEEAAKRQPPFTWFFRDEHTSAKKTIELRGQSVIL